MSARVMGEDQQAGCGGKAMGVAESMRGCWKSCRGHRSSAGVAECWSNCWANLEIRWRNEDLLENQGCRKLLRLGWSVDEIVKGSLELPSRHKSSPSHWRLTSIAGIAGSFAGTVTDLLLGQHDTLPDLLSTGRCCWGRLQELLLLLLLLFVFGRVGSTSQESLDCRMFGEASDELGSAGNGDGRWHRGAGTRDGSGKAPQQQEAEVLQRLWRGGNGHEEIPSYVMCECLLSLSSFFYDRLCSRSCAEVPYL